MKKASVFILFSVVCLLVGFLMISVDSVSFGAAEMQARPSLSNDDCIKCHEGPPEAIASDGAKHKLVTCQDCHAGHPPKVKKPIPVCSQCHQGKKHYEIKGCLTCHRNPHTPLNITFPEGTTEGCLSCHGQQITQLKDHKSKHTALSCTACHSSKHRKKPDCTQCHKPHSSDMAAADCKTCHKAHMPKVIAYGDVQSKFCASCHKNAFDLLKASTFKHKDFDCSFCHQSRHKAIPKCQDCHGSPHPAGILAKFPNCNECHKIAHDLNNWPAKKEPAKKTKK